MMAADSIHWQGKRMQTPNPSGRSETLISISAITNAQMQAWTAIEAVAAVKDGIVSAQAYLAAMVERAKALSDLNAMITLDGRARFRLRSASMQTDWLASPWVRWRGWSSSSKTTSTARV